MEVRGYKAFKSNLKNKYDKDFEVGVVYSKDPDTLKYGENGHGYHMAAKLADTFRFFNPCRDNVYCEVLGFGNVIKSDEYLYDSDSMYVVEKFKIIKILTREDIFKYVCDADIDEFRRCLALFPFTSEELKILRDIVIVKGKKFQKLFEDSMGIQTGNIVSFKRNSNYLRR